MNVGYKICPEASSSRAAQILTSLLFGWNDFLANGECAHLKECKR